MTIRAVQPGRSRGPAPVLGGMPGATASPQPINNEKKRMTETTTSPSKTPRPKQRKLRDFEVAMASHIREALRNASKGLVLPPLVLLAGAAAGALLGLLPSPAGTVVPIALAAAAVTAALVVLVIAYRKDPVKDVDWATADDYAARVTADLPPLHRGILSTARRTVRARVPTAEHVHLYVMGPEPEHQPSCTVDAGGCKCAPLRLTAAFAPNRRRPTLVIGERLLHHPNLLAFVLTHEAHHARRASRTMHMALSVPLLAGWLALGLTVPPGRLLVVAPAVLLVTNAARWADELRADVIGIRAAGARAAIEYWAKVQAARLRPSGVRLLLALALIPMMPHPPFAVRAALAKRMLRRTT